MEWWGRASDTELQAGGWRPVVLTLAVHLAFFGVLLFGLHWKRSLPAPDDGVLWVVPAEMPAPDSAPDSAPDAEGLAPDPAAPIESEISLGSKGGPDGAGSGAREPASHKPQASGRDAESGPAKKQAANPEATDDDAKSDETTPYDIRVPIASSTDFEVSSFQRETNIAVEFALSLRPDGTIADLQLVKASDDPEFDKAVRAGIVAAQPYPQKLVAQSPSLNVTIRAMDVDVMHRFPGRTNLP